MNMKSKKKLFIVSLFALCCFMINISVVSNAMTVKLNKTKATITQGKTLKLSVSGTKSTVKWTSSNKSVATVSSSGTVKAKSKGTATITSKVYNKKLKCKITVKGKKSYKNVEYELQDTGNGVVAIIKNKNKYPVSVEVKLVYLKSSGKMIDTDSDDIYCLEPSGTCALFFQSPHDSSYRSVNYANFKITLNVEKSSYNKYAASKISIKANRGSDNITIRAKNNSKYNLDTIKISIVFYDKNKNAIGYDYHYAECENKGTSDYLSFSYPYDDNYDTIYPVSYKIYVNHAYKYN